MLLGLAVNLAAARLATGMSSLWWNAVGFAVTACVAVALSRRVSEWTRSWNVPRPESLVLGGDAAAMFVVIALMPPRVALMAAP